MLLGQAEAWAKLPQLNFTPADGHLFIGLPDWRGHDLRPIFRPWVT